MDIEERGRGREDRVGDREGEYHFFYLMTKREAGGGEGVEQRLQIDR